MTPLCLPCMRIKRPVNLSDGKPPAAKYSRCNAVAFEMSSPLATSCVEVKIRVVK